MTSVYKKLSHREHILQLPDTYIGSVDTIEDSRWVFDKEKNKIIYKTLKFNPGLYKLFDEVLVNARDALVRSRNIKHIEVNCGIINGNYMITVKNDGDGIPIEYSKEKNDNNELMYVPELIFGQLLTSSNYNKDEEKIVGNISI